MTTTKSNPIQTVQPYLIFEGRCEEAIEFYRSALGAEVIMLMRFKDSPEPGMCAPGAENKVLHASLRIGETTLMASDGRCQGKLSFQGFSLSLAVLNESEAERLFASVAEGGQVQMPLTKTFFSPCFGMVTDRFGVSWMIIVPAEAIINDQNTLARVNGEVLLVVGDKGLLVRMVFAPQGRAAWTFATPPNVPEGQHRS